MLNTTYSNILKWLQTIKVSWAKYTAYRLDFFLQMIGPALVFFFIKYNLWSSIYGGNSTLVIQGYDFNQMITYHVWALIVGLVGQGYFSMNLAEDIRLGRISTYLIYPFNFWEFHTAGFLSFQLLQLIVSSVTLTVIIALGIIPLPAFSVLIMGFFYCALVSFYWFSLQYFTGLLAFWLEETWILRVILNIITAFLSGAFFPLDLYPEWLVKILNYTPFPWLTYYPIKLFMGTATIQLLPMAILLAWIVIFCLINSLIWRKGVRLYTAAGM